MPTTPMVSMAWRTSRNCARNSTKCMKCGMCMSVCPVYASEKVKARWHAAKIVIAEAVLSGDPGDRRPEVIDTLFNCLVCKSCMQACLRVSSSTGSCWICGPPSLKKRAAMVETAIFAGLKKPAVMDGAMKVGAVLKGLVFRENTRCGYFAAFAFRHSGARTPASMKSPVSHSGHHSVRDRVPELIPAPDAKMRVAFFTGCSFHYFYPGTGQDLIDVLTENHVEVVVPKGQQCCGTPVLVHGDTDSARTLAKANIDVMEKSSAAYIVTGCGLLRGRLAARIPTFVGAGPGVWTESGVLGCAHLRHLHFPDEIVHYRVPRGQVDAVVTYHDSCHLKSR